MCVCDDTPALLPVMLSAHAHNKFQHISVLAKKYKCLCLSVVEAYNYKKRCASQSPAKCGGALSGTLYFAQHIIKHGRQPNSRHLRASSRTSASISLTSAPFLWAQNRLHPNAKVAVPHLQIPGHQALVTHCTCACTLRLCKHSHTRFVFVKHCSKKTWEFNFWEQQATQVQVQSSPRLTPTLPGLAQISHFDDPLRAAFCELCLVWSLFASSLESQRGYQV